jgi:hypothetical protein
VLVALDGSEHFCSRKITCPHCPTRLRSDGQTEYFHSFVGATLVAPGHTLVLPLPPEFVRPQDGAKKQDCEPLAARRWLSRVGSAYAWLARSISATTSMPTSRCVPPFWPPAAVSSSAASRPATKP